MRSRLPTAPRDGTEQGTDGSPAPGAKASGDREERGKTLDEIIEAYASDRSEAPECEPRRAARAGVASTGSLDPSDGERDAAVTRPQ